MQENKGSRFSLFFSIVCVLIGIALQADRFLPSSNSIEKVTSHEDYEVPTGYSIATGETRVYVIHTRHFKVELTHQLYDYLNNGDEVRFHHSPFFKVINMVEVPVADHSQVIDFVPDTNNNSLGRAMSIVLILFSIFCFFIYKNIGGVWIFLVPQIGLLLFVGYEIAKNWW